MFHQLWHFLPGSRAKRSARRRPPAPPSKAARPQMEALEKRELLSGNSLADSSGPLNQRYVAALYEDLLQRSADPSGLAHWGGALDQGASRDQVVRGIMDSFEYRTNLVLSFYDRFLDRAAEPAGLDAWLRFLAQGSTAEHMEAEFLGSPEYWVRRAGESTEGFLEVLYRDVLYRGTDAVGTEAWGQALGNGHSRSGVALGVLTSLESDHNEVRSWYSQFLYRAADDGGLNAWVAALQGGAPDQEVIVSLAGSEEYLRQPRLPPLTGTPGAGWIAGREASSLRFDPGANQGGPQFVPNQLLLQFKAGVSEADKAQARGRAAAVLAEIIQTGGGRVPLEVVSIPAHIPLAAAIQALKSHPAVAFAEPNYWVYNQTTSNDPYYTNGSLWGMDPANSYGSQAGTAWAAEHTGSGTVYVGVIDEGIQYTHLDLDANAWTNPYDPVDGVDNDGNHYKDDNHGWDFFRNDNSIYDGGKGGSQDDHGTHVTGTLGAEGGNATGVAGVNWSVTYISGKFLGPGGGSTSNAIKALDYFTDLKTRHGLNIVATNNSWGGGGYSQALLDAIIRAANANILFVAAAGNSGSNNDKTPSYPASYNTTAGAGYDAVISVAAIASNGALASFSNYGATTVDIGAPGVGIYSTLPFNKYGSYSGTSMATPHVTGAAALYASTHPGATASQIKAAILGAAEPTASLAGKTVTGGRLDVSKWFLP